MARVAITGAEGLVGRALTDELGRQHKVFALSHRDLDVTDAAAVQRVCRDLRPHTIFNCAVVGVDECEQMPDLARAVNVDGPANLASAAQSLNGSIVHFSTNYVFDDLRRPATDEGRRDPANFFTIDDEPRPVNVYGRTKLDGERAVLERCANAFVIRTSWVFGEGKESFLSGVGRRLARGERVQAIGDVWASTTFVRDLVRRLGSILAAHRGTYHVVNGGVCSYEEFAREAARLVDADPALIDRVSEERLMRAPRPHYTPMRCLESERIGLPPMRHWTEALAEYLAG